MKQIRITGQNHKRLVITSGALSLTKKINQILDLYFDSLGGIRERKRIEKDAKKHLPHD